MRRLLLLLLLPLGLVVLCLILASEFVRRPSPHPAAAPSAEPDESSPARPAADDNSPLPDETTLERLARTDPIAFVRNSLRRYDREVKGYRLTLQKQERINGKLQRPEVIEAEFRENPYSVVLNWAKGARLAQKILYVKGENNNMLLVKPAGLASLVGIVERDPEGPEARQSGRYPVTRFSLRAGAELTLNCWEAAQKQNALHVECLGPRRIKETGDRVCFGFKRTGYLKPEEDGITESTLYFDKETWLQVGSVLKGAEGQLIGEYFYRDFQLNPDFKPGTFTRQALK